MDVGIGLISFNHKSLNKDCINAFWQILEISKKQILNLLKGKYLYEDYMDYRIISKELTLEAKKSLNLLKMN